MTRRVPPDIQTNGNRYIEVSKRPGMKAGTDQIFKINRQDYILVEKIGNGSFGQVFKALKVGDYDYCVIKVVKTNKPSVVQITQQELLTLEYLTEKLGDKSPLSLFIG